MFFEELKYISMLTCPGCVKAQLYVYHSPHDEDPLVSFMNDPVDCVDRWFGWDQNGYSVGDVVFGFVKTKGDIWTLISARTVTSVNNVQNGIKYVGQELTQYSDLVRKVQVLYHKGHNPPVWELSQLRGELQVCNVQINNII